MATPRRGYSSGQSLVSMEKLAKRYLPTGLRHRMDRHRLPAKGGGQHRGLVFALAVVFVFLVLAAQYESLVLPLAIILIVPMCLLAAMIGREPARHGQ
jgi:multidrug efflux pump subunit AcrB